MSFNRIPRRFFFATKNRKCEIVSSFIFMIDLSIPLNQSLTAFGASPVSIESSWCVGKDDSVNADTVKGFNAHLHSTHTESIYHIIDKTELNDDERAKQ